MVPALHRLSHASPAQPGPAPLSHRSATAAVTAASRPSLTGTTTSSRIAQYARCRPAIGATLKTGSVNQGGSSSVQVAGHTAPPRTLCSYFSSQDPDPKGSHTGPTETTLPLTILEHARKICSPSTTTMVARQRCWTEEQLDWSRLGLTGPRGSSRPPSLPRGLTLTTGRATILAQRKLLKCPGSHSQPLNTTRRPTPSHSRHPLRAGGFLLDRAWTTSRWATVATAHLFTAKQAASCSRLIRSGTLHTLAPT